MKEPYELKELVPSEIMDELLDLFTALAGVAGVVTDTEGNYISKRSRYTRHCTDFIQATTEGRKACKEFSKKLGHQALKNAGAAYGRCPFHLYECRLPIMVEGKAVGFLGLGQIVPEEPQPEKHQAIAAELGLDPEAFLEALGEVPCMDLEDFQKKARLLGSLACLLVHQGMARLRAEKEAERQIKRAENLYQHLPMGINILSPELDIIRVNRFVEKKLGVSCAQVRGTKCYLVAGQYRDDPSRQGKDKICDNCPAQAALRSGSPERVVRKVRGDCFVENTAVPVRDDSGRITEIMEIIRDVTEEIRSREEISRSRDYLNGLINSMFDGLMVVDRKLRIVDVNAHFLSVYGGTREEVLGRACYEVTHRLDRPCHALGRSCPAREVFETGRPVVREMTHINSMGEKAYMEVGAAPLRNAEGEVDRVIEVTHDVTPRKRMEEELRRSEEFNRRIIENSIDCIKILDLNGRLQFMSRGGQRLMEIDDIEPFINESWIDFWKGSYREAALRALNMASRGKTGMFDGYCPTLNGKPKWWNVIISPLFGKEGNVESLLAISRDITARKKADEARETSEKRFRLVVEHAGEAIFIAQDGCVKFPNLATERLTGYPRDELEGMPLTLLIHPEDREMVLDRYRRRIKGEDVATGYPFRVIDRTGETHWVSITSTRTAWEGRPATLNFVTDITEQKRLEVQLLQAQKLESVGRLAGGVAHDFNNMLSVILGYAQLALDKVDPCQPLHLELQEIFKAARRAADITRQLLAFARKQTIAPRALDLNDTVEGLLKMLRRLVGEEIDLAWQPDTNLWLVKMDPVQIDQILANLCINARDAIAGTGKITIETGNVVLDESYCAAHAGFLPGDYVMLAVSDDGCGMDKETLEKLFEPFFTTKEVGKGTGLGLSTVYGIVKQNEGFINVYSERGEGTTFKIYLPRHHAREDETNQEGAAPIPQGRGERVLLVEDELSVLSVGKKMLEGLGYSVLAAASPGEAVEVAEMHPGEIHLLITDVVLPEMSGPELAERLKGIRPGIRCLYMSGYTANAIAHRGVLAEGVHFIQKPFSVKDLALKVKEVLEEGG